MQSVANPIIIIIGWVCNIATYGITKVMTIKIVHSKSSERE